MTIEITTTEVDKSRSDENTHQSVSVDKDTFSRFSNEILHSVIFAKAASIAAGTSSLHLESMLVGFLVIKEENVIKVLEDNNLNPDEVVKRLKKRLLEIAREEGNIEGSFTYEEIKISPEIVQMCRGGRDIRDEIEKGGVITTLDLFRAILSMEGNEELLIVMSPRKLIKINDDILHNKKKG